MDQEDEDFELRKGQCKIAGGNGNESANRRHQLSGVAWVGVDGLARSVIRAMRDR